MDQLFLEKQSKPGIPIQKLGELFVGGDVPKDFQDALNKKIKASTPPVNMGMGKLGSPSLVFPRTFRFLAEPKSSPKLAQYMRKIDIDYYKRELELEVFEIENDTHNWLVQLVNAYEKEDIKIDALDGCGNIMYTLYLLDVKMKAHTVSYSYDSSDVVTHKVKFSYSKMDRIDKKPVDK